MLKAQMQVSLIIYCMSPSNKEHVCMRVTGINCLYLIFFINHACKYYCMNILQILTALLYMILAFSHIAATIKKKKCAFVITLIHISLLLYIIEMKIVLFQGQYFFVVKTVVRINFYHNFLQSLSL